MDVDSDGDEGNESDQVLTHHFQEAIDGSQDEVIIPFSNPEVLLQHTVVNLEPNYVQPGFSMAERVPSVIDLTEDSDDCQIQETDEKKELKTTTHEFEDDGDICPICLESWTNSGEHRICALKCGHLFGYKCVNRWLHDKPKKSCPLCKESVGKNELRFIYAKKLVAVDTAELDLLKQQLDLSIEEKNQASINILRYVCREYILNQEIVQLKRQIEELKNGKHESKSLAGDISTDTHLESIRSYIRSSLEFYRQKNKSLVFYTRTPKT